MKLLKYTRIIIFFVVLVLLILHLFNFIVVDNTTILLIVLLLVVPLSGSLKKIKFGEFEAEIGSKEVEKIESKVKELPEDEISIPYEINETVEQIYSFLEDDRILALAKIRIELEKILFKILFTKKEESDKKISLSSALRRLVDIDLIDKRYVSPIKDVISVCNRAIHGEEIDKKTAETIVDIGIDLLKKLHKDFYKLISEPAESEAISSKERDEYSDSKYYVITVVPLVDGPHLNKYIFNQEELDQFLDGYNEFAEFLVEIKKIKSSS